LGGGSYFSPCPAKSLVRKAPTPSERRGAITKARGRYGRSRSNKKNGTQRCEASRDIEPACNSSPLSRPAARGSDNQLRSDRQACVQGALALSSQRRVASSVQPGTAKLGAVTPWLGTITCGRARRCNVRCTVVALAEAHRLINRPKAKTERIAFTPIDLTIVLM